MGLVMPASLVELFSPFLDGVFILKVQPNTSALCPYGRWSGMMNLPCQGCVAELWSQMQAPVLGLMWRAEAIASNSGWGAFWWSSWGLNFMGI